MSPLSNLSFHFNNTLSKKKKNLTSVSSFFRNIRKNCEEKIDLKL